MHRFFQAQLIALLLFIAFFASNAFASTKTALAPKQGEGATTISGWNISNVHYHLAEDASKISAVELELDGPANQVAISFGIASDRAFSCYNTNEHHWLCRVDGIEVAQINTIRVIAAS